MFFYMYIIKSLKDGKLYFGSTSDLRKRLKEHNSGLNQSTKSRKPFKLVYYETYISKEDAKQREQNLKLRARALRQLIKRVKRSLAS
jgi:putative endonuclease